MSNQGSLLTSLFEHRLAFSKVIDNAAASPSAQSANQLKAQLLILSQWLWALSNDNLKIVTSQCLYQPTKYSPLANKSFGAGVLTTNFCRQLSWHPHCALGLISSSLAMDIGLSLTEPTLAIGWFNVNKLPDNQRRHYLNHPMTTASYLHKYQVINKHLLKAVMQHHELINYSGFPNQIGYNNLSTASKILALVAKCIELISFHPKRPCYSIKQALRYLAQHQDHYCPLLTRHLAIFINRPSPTMTIELADKSLAIIHTICEKTAIATLIVLEKNNQDKLTIGKKISEIKLNKISQIIAINSIYSEVKFSVLWGSIELHERDEPASSTARLQPSSNLSTLLKELDANIPDPLAISVLINKLPQLGQALVQQLAIDYPTSTFNDSEHAIQMVGFDQSKSLLARLGLASQLNLLDFPARQILVQKTKIIIAICKKMTQFTSCIMPNQAAMFCLLNIAPLYCERSVLELPARLNINLHQVNPNQIYSLLGLKNSEKQAPLSYSFAKKWDHRAPTLKALNVLNKQSQETTLYQEEIINIFQLSLLLTHHVSEGIDLSDQSIGPHLNSLARTMKLNAKNIDDLVNHALASAPFCELSQDL